MRKAISALAALLAVLAALPACSGAQDALRHGEGLDVASLPAAVQPDYAVYASRCSKCHSLARSLESGIDDDAYWARYVARMRRQPASGISTEDEIVILRFLHYYSEDLRRKKASRAAVSASAAPSVSASAVPSASASAAPSASAPPLQRDGVKP